MPVPGQASLARKQLTYVAAADLMSAQALSANTPFNFVTQSFTVDRNGSLVTVNVRGIGLVAGTGVATNISVYFQIDNTGTLYRLNGYSNSSGVLGSVGYSGSVAIAGLSSGSHAIWMYIVSTVAATVSLRCSTVPNESFAIDVAELR
jgi:hypothetical protein